MHKDKKIIYNKRGGTFGKTIVMGLLIGDAKKYAPES